MIPYGRQTIEDDDIAAVVAVMKGDWLTQGPAVEAFEAGVMRTTGAAHAVAFANGTAALHAAAAVSGLGPGDVVATTPLTFAASANCARYVGAGVRFVDIDPTTLNIDVAAVPACDALVAVHFAGLPVDLGGLARRPRVVIEDAAHAIGAATPDGPVGNCARSDMCVFSFHPVKTVTTGEGGAVTTNSDALADALRRFRSHGMTRPAGLPGWRYEIDEIGYNFRLSDLHAALGSSQLDKLGRFLDRRHELAARYRELLGGFALTLPPEAPPGWRHGLHLFPVQVAHRDTVYEGMRRRGIGVQVHYLPVHLLGAYRESNPEPMPNAERAAAGLLSLPLFPALRDDEQDTVVSALAASIEEAAA